MRELARAQGYSSISRGQGISSFLAALHQDCGHLLIGLDAAKPTIRRYIEHGSCGLQELLAYFAPTDPALSTRELEELSVEDRYGTPTQCRIRPLDRMPLMPSGDIDRQQLSQREQPETQSKDTPRTEVERELAVIWSAALRVDPIGRNDNFFDLGGHSLSATEITFKIQETFEINFPLKDFLQAPVLSAQAQLLEQKLLEQLNANVAGEAIGEPDATISGQWEIERRVRSN
jgi:acyl carrier protein